MSNDLRQLMNLAAQQTAREAELAEAEAVVKAKKAEVLELSEKVIPDLMKSLELTKVTMEDGRVLELEESYAASIPKARQEEAFTWLRDNGHGTIIKDQITIWLDKDTPLLADTLMQTIRDVLGETQAAERVERKQSVHASTLKAFVNEQIEEGAEIPMESFGIFPIRRSKFKATKKAKGAAAMEEEGVDL